MRLSFTRHAAIFVTATLLVEGAFFASGASAAGGHGQASGALFETLKKSKTALLSCKSYSIVMTSTDEQGKTSRHIMQVIPPNRYHIRGAEIDMIVLPEGSYSRKNGHWTRLPMDMSKLISGMTSVSGEVSEEGAKHTTVKLLGPTVWHGSPALLYSTVYAAAGRQSNTKIWIRVSDRLPLRSEGVVLTKKASFGGKTIGGKRTTVVDYDYTTPVTIAAPKPK